MENNAHTPTAEEILQSKVVALEKMATIGEMVGGIAHEIKNPISFINNFAELSLSLVDEMVSDISKPDSKTEYSQVKDTIDTIKHNLQQIAEQGKRVESILKRMLAQAKGEADQFTLTDINHLLDESALLTYHGMRANDTAFNIKFDKQYDPSLGSFYTVQEDLGRVFMNLFNNAYYAVQKKKQQMGDAFEPSITIISKKTGDQCEIRIRDNGEGVSNKIKDKLFTKFFTTKESSHGTGLGLVLSRDVIVNKHQGTLTFTSEEGKYTEFIITFPIRSTP